MPLASNKVAMSASNDVLEASIATQGVLKEGYVASSPSPLIKNKKLANRDLFAMSEMLAFASSLHLLCCN